MIFFTSDTHFFHKNIIDYSNRKFSSVEQMNSELIKNWNNVVGMKDEVYHLGDVSLGGERLTGEILSALNGKIYLIKGNHEKSVLKKEHTRIRFEWIKDYYELKIDNKLICMMHYPLFSWHGQVAQNSWHLHGHSHAQYNPQIPRILDVGVDNPSCNYSPFSIDEISNIFNEVKK